MAIKSDPRRLPRRNHYQEGPGFLFVATQGGRPREPIGAARRPRSCGDGAGRSGEWRDGEAIESICREAGCSRATLVPLAHTLRADGMAGLVDRYRPVAGVELPRSSSGSSSRSGC